MSLSEPFIRRPVATILLTAGVALAGITAFGPSKEAARLEGSKRYAKELMEAGEDVYFYDSESCYLTLILLGMSGSAAADRIRLARFGPLAG